LVFEIDRDRASRPGRRVLTEGGRQRTWIRPFDSDDVGTEVSENHAGKRHRANRSQFDNVRSFQRSRHGDSFNS